MPSSAKSASKHEYDKPRLKQQIDAAVAAFLKDGRTVEQVPSVLVREPPAVQREADQRTMPKKKHS